MAGLVPAIHDYLIGIQDVDARVEPAHDEAENYAWPSVSNIEARIASGADLPAQTTNWKDG